MMKLNQSMNSNYGSGIMGISDAN